MGGNNGVVRDPIHGDIGLDRLSREVIDAVPFQRLRYIRQNALLHFVFPGAVHTRFAHSIGTMHLARAAVAQLFLPFSSQEPAVQYLSTLVQLGALLHDIGHCAFSHSIEEVRLNGQPYLGTVESIAHEWGEGDFLDTQLRPTLEARFGKSLALIPLDHEILGAFFIKRIFDSERVSAAAHDRFKIVGAILGQDVNCLLENAPPSDYLASMLEQFGVLLQQACDDGGCFGMVDKDDRHFGVRLLATLHTLVSGTLDVDRLDYLQRDSLHCGVPYGNCDARLLIRNLRLGGVGGVPSLGIEKRAVHCVEDMLWSRYQLFLQVYNHKTNVGINAVLAQAIKDATEDNTIGRPREYEHFLSFTDDYVMSRVYERCLRGALRGTIYAKALVHRTLPKWHGSLEDPAPADIATKRAAVAAETGIEEGRVLVGVGKSVFIKEGGMPPAVDTATGDIIEPERAYPLTSRDKLPPSLRYFHFYTER